MKKHRFIRSFLFALQGVRQVFTTEANMKIHLVFAVLVIICGILFKISVTEWMLCLLSFGLVMSMEMINTAIEKFVDFITPEYNSAAGKTKDIAAGAVLISALFAAIVGLIIFVPKGLLFLSELIG
jgi:diacylglycerol kinase (ATP)